MTIAKNGQPIGDIVFELYQNKNPKTAENFMALCTGSNPLSKSLVGTVFDKGFPGLVMQGGVAPKTDDCYCSSNTSAEGIRIPDEDMTLRHHSRGILSMANEGENCNG